MEHDVAHQEDRNDATELLIIISKLRTNIADLEKDRAIIVNFNGQYEFTTDAGIAKQHSILLKNMIESEKSSIQTNECQMNQMKADNK